MPGARAATRPSRAPRDGGKVALVTGATSGIGLETAVMLAERGWHSVGTYRSESKLAALQEASRAASVSVHALRLEVTDAKGCESAVAEVVARYGGIDALVNNAGYGLTGAVEDTGDAEARRILETMVVAPARLSRLVLPHFRAARGGRIVNVSSIYGRTTTPLSGWYQAAKHALEALSDALRAEVASDGVVVVLVEPGGFRTGIWDGVAEGAPSPGGRYEKAYARSQQALKLASPLLGDPKACARVIVAALESRSPRARYLVGADARIAAAVMPFTPAAVKDRLGRIVLGL
ncbi:MAG: SDR family oxidoreductase [Acidimicrobiales bacterium]